MTSKYDCFGPGFLPRFLKWVYPKDPPVFLGTCLGVRTLSRHLTGRVDKLRWDRRRVP